MLLNASMPPLFDSLVPFYLFYYRSDHYCCTEEFLLHPHSIILLHIYVYNKYPYSFNNKKTFTDVPLCTKCAQRRCILYPLIFQ